MPLDQGSPQLVTTFDVNRPDPAIITDDTCDTSGWKARNGNLLDIGPHRVVSEGAGIALFFGFDDRNILRTGFSTYLWKTIEAAMQITTETAK